MIRVTTKEENPQLEVHVDPGTAIRARYLVLTSGGGDFVSVGIGSLTLYFVPDDAAQIADAIYKEVSDVRVRDVQESSDGTGVNA